MSNLNAFDRILEETTDDNARFVDKNWDIRKQVKFLLRNHPTIKSQKDLARALGKEESEISKLLSGLHNLTLETITKLESALGHDIILTDLKAQEKYRHKEEWDGYASYQAKDYPPSEGYVMLLEVKPKWRQTHIPKSDSLVKKTKNICWQTA